LSALDRLIYYNENDREGDCMATSKFDELRTKTEIELVHVVNRELDLGILEARRALSADSWGIAQNRYVRARQAYVRASRLIPLMDVVDVMDEVPGDQQGPGERLAHLREMLDGLSVLASTPSLTGENIASLARALWKARGCPEGSPEDDWLRAEQVLKSHRALHAACC
jgi:hypothetical protein